MPAWVLVGENADGVPVVIVDRLMRIETAPIADVKRGTELAPVVFRDRWRAKRVLRARNEWRNFRAIRLDRL